LAKTIKVIIEVLEEVTYSVISGEPRIESGAGAGIQNRLKILDSGSRFALNTMRCRASLARNADFPVSKSFAGASIFSVFLPGRRRARNRASRLLPGKRNA
jgi:hypothetical protein